MAFLLLHKHFQANISLFAKQSIKHRQIPMKRYKQDISSASLQAWMRFKNA